MDALYIGDLVASICATFLLIFQQFVAVTNAISGSDAPLRTKTPWDATWDCGAWRNVAPDSENVQNWHRMAPCQSFF